MSVDDRLAEAGDTPYLVVDREILERNLATMAELARTAGFALRPHAKTHKCLPIARRQLELGATGLTVATVGEAELFADAGFDDLFIAYPVWAAGARAARLRALAARVRLRVGTDSVPGVAALAAALAGSSAEVLVEIDSGQHRSGVLPERAAEVAQAAERAGLAVRGVFTFPGHGYGPGNRAAAARDEAAALAGAAATLNAAGFMCAVVSGGCTPTAMLSDQDALTEIRPGVYPFYDAQQVELEVCGWPDVALTAMSTVVSVAADRVVLDAGSKVLGADRPAWATGFGRLPDHPDARITALSEHHATVAFPSGPGPLGHGDRVRVAPNHVCNAVNLATEMWAVAPDQPTERWPVAARGANT
ncbi:MAG TPA: alanine racemase [Pseudonocardia sp.]|nr:alanine racemase [Pseudonocardia sp.]